MRVLYGLIGVVSLGAGCDSLFPTVPGPTPYSGPEYRYGTVHWEGATSDCADGGWTSDETVMAVFDGDEVSLWFDTMPELTGTLRDGTATVAGEMQFTGSTGATVSCVVDGDVAVASDALSGAMHERLSSRGDVNCDTRGRYTIRFSE